MRSVRGITTSLLDLHDLGTDDISKFSEIALKMKFCTEGLRMVGRVLNYPTDAHTLAAQAAKRANFMAGTARRVMSDGAGEVTSLRYANVQRNSTPLMLAASPDKTSGAPARSEALVGTREDEDKLSWLNTIFFEQTEHVSSALQALLGARGQAVQVDEDKIDHPTKTTNKEVKEARRPRVKLTCAFELGGILVLKGASDDDADTLLKLMAGPPTLIPQPSACIVCVRQGHATQRDTRASTEAAPVRDADEA